MPDPSTEALLSEYAATNEAYLHYDAFSWQVGSVLVAGVFVFWGFLLQEKPAAALFVAAGMLVTVIMSAWILYADHNRQIYLQKLDRLHELETLLGLKQHLRWITGHCTTFGPRGHSLNLAIYTVMCVGVPVIQRLVGDPSLHPLAPLAPVPVVLIWIHRSERRLSHHRELQRGKTEGATP